VRTKAHKRQISKYALYKLVSQCALFITLVSLVSVIVFVLIRGAPYVNTRLLFGEYDGKSPTIGPALVGSIYLIFISIAIAAPIRDRQRNIPDRVYEDKEPPDPYYTHRYRNTGGYPIDRIRHFWLLGIRRRSWF